MQRPITAGLLLFALSVASGDLLAASSKTPPPPAAGSTALAGSWTGAWRGANFVYDALVNLNVNAAGEVSGIINWTLRSAPNGSGKSKIGLRAIEYVSGKYYP